MPVINTATGPYMDYQGSYGRLAGRVRQITDQGAKLSQEVAARKKLDAMKDDIGATIEQTRAEVTAGINNSKSVKLINRQFENIKRKANAGKIDEAWDELIEKTVAYGTSVDFYEQNKQYLTAAHAPRPLFGERDYVSRAQPWVKTGKEKTARKEVAGLTKKMSESELASMRLGKSPEKYAESLIQQPEFSRGTHAPTPGEVESIAIKHGATDALAPEIEQTKQHYVTAGRRALQDYGAGFDGRSEEEYRRGAVQLPEYGAGQVTDRMIDAGATGYPSHAELNMMEYRQAKARIDRAKANKGDAVGGYDLPSVIDDIATYDMRLRQITSDMKKVGKTKLDARTGQEVANPEYKELLREKEQLDVDLRMLRNIKRELSGPRHARAAADVATARAAEREENNISAPSVPAGRRSGGFWGNAARFLTGTRDAESVAKDFNARQEAIQVLKNSGVPATEKNIQIIIQRLHAND